VLQALALFLASLTALLVAARLFTRSAERVGLALGMSPFAIGVLIVSTGTSLPELVSSIVAVRRGASEIVVGNVLGANLSNLLLVMGVVAVASRRPIRLGDQYILIDLHFLLGSAFLLAMALRDGTVGRVEGGFLLAAYGVYVRYLMKEGRTDKDLSTVAADESHVPRGRVPRSDAAVLVATSALIYLGARYTISSLETLARQAGVPPDLVALTLLSVGTTLPELVVSASAARAGKADVAVGNILGSCVFNGLAVAGTASVVGPLTATAELLGLPLPVLGTSVLFFYLLTLDKRVSRWEGMVLLMVYGLFLMEVARLV
jgi:cation:H+ antiporter